MENFNELVCLYYSAVDENKKEVAEELLKEILDSLAKDPRILKVLKGLSYSDKDEIISELNYEFWKTGLNPEKRWDLNKGAQFITWMVRKVKSRVIDIFRKNQRYQKKNGANDLGLEEVGENKRIKDSKYIWFDEKRKELEKNLPRLNPIQRETIIYLTLGYKSKEIAILLKIDESSVSRTKKTAIKLLGNSPEELGSFIGMVIQLTYKKILLK